MFEGVEAGEPFELGLCDGLVEHDEPFFFVRESLGDVVWFECVCREERAGSRRDVCQRSCSLMAGA